MFLDEMSQNNRTMYMCVVNIGEGKNRDLRRMKVFPAFPWKFDKDVDHTAEDPGVFFRACENAGMVRHVRKEDDRSGGLTMTYKQWLEKHKDEPGFINNMEGKVFENAEKN